MKYFVESGKLCTIRLDQCELCMTENPLILRFVNLSIIADSSGGWFGTDVNNRACTSAVGTRVGIGNGVGFYSTVSITV